MEAQAAPGQVQKVHQVCRKNYVCWLLANQLQMGKCSVVNASGGGADGRKNCLVCLVLLQFVQSVGLGKRPFHLFGSSMGGIIAGVYAAKYPTDLSGLTLIWR